MRSRIFLFLISVLAVTNLSGRTLRMVADTWAPYTDRPGDMPGFMVELATLAAHRAGYEVTYSMEPWSRAVTEVKRGEAELLLAVLPLQIEKEGLVPCSEPIAFDRNQFFTLTTSHWVFDGVASLAGQRLGVVQDYEYGELLNRYIAVYASDETRVSFSLGDIPIQTSLRKLIAGRVTAIVDDPNVVHWNARQMGVDGRLRFAGAADAPVGIFMAVSPKLSDARDIAAKFAVALRALEGTPEYMQLCRRYGITEDALPKASR